MASNPRRFYLCTGQCVTADKLDQYPDSHIIGELRYVSDEGCKNVTALMVYRRSLLVTNKPTAMPKVLCRQLGDVRGFECLYPRCSNSWDWHISHKTAEILLRELYAPVKRKEVVE
jgi:hypothetical protein